MKKFFGIMCSFVLAFVLLLAGCGKTAAPPAGTPALRLRSQKEQALKVGESMTLVWSTSNTKLGVSLVSTDEDVVTVDPYGSVEAVGVGTADVVITLKEDESVSESVHFTVTRTFFMQENGYRNGTIDFSGDEAGEAVYISDGQAQLLVNRAGQTWYFKAHIARTGFTNGDNGGRWGVGSFLVNATTRIGDVMLWAGFQNRDDEANSCVPYTGGWRTTGGAEERENELHAPIQIGGEATLTIVRRGIRHYVIFEGGGETVKTVVDVPKFEGVDTFPGVYGQNQKLTVTNYSASNEEAEVLTVLDSFQSAEDVSVNGLDDRLVAGKEYHLTATVLPDITINKNVTWGLETQKEGVSLSADGTLTLASSVRGDITVRATAQSGQNVTSARTFHAIEQPASASALFDEGMLLGEGVTAEGTNVTVTSGNCRLPLKAYGDKWYVSATVQGAAAVNGGRAGFMSATNGYMRYYRYGLCGDVGAARQAEFGEGYLSAVSSRNYAANSDNGHSFTSENELGLLKDGAVYYFFANGKLIAKEEASFDEAAFPVLYSDGCGVTFKNVAVETNAQAVDTLLAGHKFFVGGYVTKAENSYTLAKADFGEANNMNWPPDNGYMNGLKYAIPVTGDYTLQFTMSEIDPVGSTYDAKVLVYLKSEHVTASIQFIIKGSKEFPEVRLCINLDDNSWNEYDFAGAEQLLTGKTQVKVVKNAAGAELWLNGTQLTSLTLKGSAVQAEPLLRNNNYWGASTACTPGIGTFKCGVRIEDPVITVG